MRTRGERQGEDGCGTDKTFRRYEHGTMGGGRAVVVTSTVFSLLEMQPAELRIALIGASRHRHKFGAIILDDLLGKGFEVWPVSPHGQELHGRPVVSTVDQVPGPIHIVSLVLPPSEAQGALERLDPDTNALVWFQPGSYNADLLKWARGQFRNVLAGPCIMVETQNPCSR
ncbi:MAG: CoA-binding protein [Myxococcota bacterium]